MKNDILVFNYAIAKTLLKEGYVIVDMEENKKKEHSVIYYFRNEKNIMDRLNEIIKIRRERKN